MSYEVTVAIPIGPYKPWVENLLLNAINNLQLPFDDCQILFIDNSGTGIGERLASVIFKDHGNVPTVKVDNSNMDKNISLKEINKKLAYYWDYFIQTASGRFVLSLEHDVLPQCGTYSRLKKLLDGVRLAGASACPAKTRHTEHGNVIMVREVIPYGGPFSPLRIARPKRSGCQPTAWASLCCAMFRTELIKDLVIHTKAGLISSIGTEGILYRHLWSKERTAWVDWSLMVKHYTNESEYV